MKIRKEVTHTINLGNYESIKIVAGAEVDTEVDFDKIPTDEQITELLDEVLDAVGGKTIDDAAELAPEDSYVHHITSTTQLTGKQEK